VSNIIVISFKDEHSAEGFMGEVGKLQRDGLLELDDAATVVRTEGGKVKVRQARSLVGEGALGGAFWGMLFGILFFVPVLGLAVGAATGALAGKFADYGIDDDFIKEVSAKVQPGDSAIFLLVSASLVAGRIHQVRVT
jgi:uncharacterized membrane protein